MADQAGSTITPLFASARNVLVSVGSGGWFTPGQPIQPQAPEGTPPRVLDFPVGYNIQSQPRAEEEVKFFQLRTLAASWDLLALVIETRKDQVAGIEHLIRPKRRPGEKMLDYKSRGQDDPKVGQLERLFLRPDGETSWDTWLREVVHEVLVTDALCILPSKNGKMVELVLVNGATVNRKVTTAGRTPAPPDPAYQQVIKGLPATNFTRDELMYRMRNKRVDHLYGYPPVEQIILTINLAIRRSLFKIGYYTAGNMPEAIIQLPDSWPISKIKEFEQWFNSILQGQDAARRAAKFIPSIGGNNAISYPKQDSLKDEMDEWLARVVCYCFSLSPQGFVKENNRATAVTAQQTAKTEGLRPLLNWLAELLTDIIENVLGYPGYEWVWEQEEAPDPMVRTQIQEIQIRNGIKGPDEIREDNGDEPIGVGPGIVTANGFEEFSQIKAMAEVNLTNAKNPPPDVVAPGDGVPSSAPPSSKPPIGKAARIDQRREAVTTALLEGFLAKQGEKAVAALLAPYAAAQNGHGKKQ